MLIFNVGKELAIKYSDIRQAGQAEAILNEILSLPILNREQRDKARLQLASTLSEQFRAKEAKHIQEQLIVEHSPLLANPSFGASLYNNLGNSYRELGKLEKACDAFERALQFDSQMDYNDVIRKENEFQTLTLLGECLSMLGNIDKAEEMWNKAELLKPLDLSGLHSIHFHSVLERCYSEANIFDKALVHLKKIRKYLYEQLERGEFNIKVWESLLSKWSYIDGRSIQILLTNNPNEESYEEALIIAEAAKGRLLSKMMAELSEKPSLYKLSLSYYKELLGKAKDDTKKQTSQKILSLFTEKDGTAIFSISEDGLVKGKWVKMDQQFKDNYELWKSLVSNINAESYSQASRLTDILLVKIGEWLVDSNIDLARGGQDLIIIPHGPLRNIPLSHCRLPDGKRLSELFEHITIFPSLYDLSNSLDRSNNYLMQTNKSAFVDPDGSLPFARIEGLLISGIEATSIGSEVTVNAIQESLSKPGIVLLSSHGIFNIRNAWDSFIVTAEGRVKLSDLLIGSKIAKDLVVLGVCDIGINRLSYSDEPIGFPGVLIKAGASAVVAPMWMVDDFSSHLFLTTFFEFLSGGMHPSSALLKTSEWLREIKASEVIEKITSMEAKFDKINAKGNISSGASDYVRNYITHYKQLLQEKILQKKSNNFCLFNSPLHWAAFQMNGLIKDNSLSIQKLD